MLNFDFNPFKPKPKPGPKPPQSDGSQGTQLPTKLREINQARQTKIATYQGPSPLQRLKGDLTKVRPEPTVVSLRYLTGPYAGQSYDVGEWLGVAVPEISHQTGADWQSVEADGVLCASNFKRLTDETFTLSVQFWASNSDIAHLTQNLTAHLREIGPGEKTPPLLLFRQGSIIMQPVFLVSSDTKYSSPGFVTGNGTGYRQAEVNLTFKLMGGKNSPSSLGAAHTSTPLQDWRKTQSDVDRKQETLTVQREELLEPCLGVEGSAQLKKILEDKKLNDAEAIQKLSPDAFVQIAIAGMVPKDILDKPAIQEKLKKDLAFVIAKSEDGVGAISAETSTQFAAAMLSGDVSKLFPKLQSQALSAGGDLKEIIKAIQSQKLSAEDEIFDRDRFPTAHNRLNKFGSCGLSIRQAQSGGTIAAGESEGKGLKDLKEFFGTTPPPAPIQVKEKFELKTEEQAKILINGSPYVSKEQFLKVAGELGGGIEAYKLWSKIAPEEEKKP